MFGGLGKILNSPIFKIALIAVSCICPAFAPVAAAIQMATQAMNTMEQAKNAAKELREKDGMPEVVANNICSVMNAASMYSGGRTATA